MNKNNFVVEGSENVFSFLKNNEAKKKTVILFSDVDEILDHYKLDVKKKGYVDIEMILKECDDVDLQFCDFEDNNVIDGTIEFKNGFYIIKINKNKSEERKRFTMAHEYSHYLFDRTMLKENSHKDLVLYRTNYANNITDKKSVDVRANYFAAELLMPEGVFRSKNNDMRGDIYKMADFFKVSTLAVKVRYSQLGIEIDD